MRKSHIIVLQAKCHVQVEVATRCDGGVVQQDYSVWVNCTLGRPGGDRAASQGGKRVKVKVKVKGSVLWEELPDITPCAE
jgi:hypothetical protein